MIFRILRVLVSTLAVLMLTGASQIKYSVSSWPVITITSVTCLKTTSGSQTDAIYIRHSEGTVFPENSPKYTVMSAGKTWEVARYIYPKSDGYFALFEADSVTDDDEIGRFDYSMQDVSGQYTVRMTGDSAEYVVIFEVRR